MLALRRQALVSSGLAVLEGRKPGCAVMDACSKQLAEEAVWWYRHASTANNVPLQDVMET